MRGEVPEQADVLIGAIDAGFRDPVRRHAVDPLAGEPDRAVIGRVEFHDAVEDGRLAGAIGPDDAVDASFLDLQIEAVDGDQAAEALGHLLRLEERRRPLPCAHRAAARRRSRLHGSCFGIDPHLAPLGRRRPQAFRLEPHHRDDRQPVEQEAEFAELAQHFRQADQHRGAERHARQAAHAADDDQRQDVDRDDELEANADRSCRAWWRRSSRQVRQRRRPGHRPAASTRMRLMPSAWATSSSSRIAIQARPSRDSSSRQAT